MVENLQKEVQELKALTLAGYVKNYDKNRVAIVVNMEQSDAFHGPIGQLLVAASWHW